MAQLQLSVVGAGQIGKRHIELIMASNRCALHSIVDPTPESMALAKQLKVPCYTSLDELLASTVQKLPHGTIIASPNQLHAQQSLDCIRHGFATFIEKPIAVTAAQGESICELAKRTHVPVLVGHHRRHSGIMAASCAVIESGRLGKPVAMQGTFMLYKAENEGYFEPLWRRSAGGGPILINMIHEVGNMRSLLGEIAAVQALSSNATREFEVEDSACINVRFANGALGSFLVSDTAASSRSWEHTSGEDPRYALSHATDDDCYVVAGTMGSLSIPSMRLKTFANAANQSWHKALTTEIIAVPAIDPMAAQLSHFCDVIEGKAAPLVSAQDGLRNLQIVEAISTSARTGAIIHI